MPGITLSKNEKQSKGRNGWFTPAKAKVLYGAHDTIALEVWSRNERGEPPIDLYLSKEDAGLVGKALLVAAGQGERTALEPDGQVIVLVNALKAIRTIGYDSTLPSAKDTVLECIRVAEQALFPY